MANKYTKETVLSEICKHPRATEILTKYHLPCLHCPMAAAEMGKLKIGQVCEMCGLDLDGLLKELNEK